MISVPVFAKVFQDVINSLDYRIRNTCISMLSAFSLFIQMLIIKMKSYQHHTPDNMNKSWCIYILLIYIWDNCFRMFAQLKDTDPRLQFMVYDNGRICYCLNNAAITYCHILNTHHRGAEVVKSVKCSSSIFYRVRRRYRGLSRARYMEVYDIKYPMFRLMSICPTSYHQHRIIETMLYTMCHSLRPRDSMRRQRSSSTLSMAMVWCLIAPSHYHNHT